MTVTETAEKPAEATREPVSAAEVDHEAAYVALRRLTVAVGQVLKAVERNSADVHKYLEELADAHGDAHDVLYPKPPPDAPDGDVVVLYAHAVRPGDLLHVRGEWVAVEDRRQEWHPNGERVMVEFVGTMPRHFFDLMEPLPVRRPVTKPREADQ